MTDNLGLILQALSLQILFQDYNNSDLMKELRDQDNKYLEKIIAQNEDIMRQLTLMMEQLKGGNYESKDNRGN